MDKKYVKKAKNFLALAGIKKPTSEQADDYNKLRSQLAAHGLNPQHTKGLEYRALVLDNMTKVETYLRMIDQKKKATDITYELKKVGILTGGHHNQQLRNIVTDIKKSATEHEKKYKSARRAVSSIRQAYADTDVAADEISEEDADILKEELEKQAEARKERERLAQESIQKWAEDVFLNSQTTPATT